MALRSSHSVGRQRKRRLPVVPVELEEGELPLVETVLQNKGAVRSPGRRVDDDLIVESPPPLELVLGQPLQLCAKVLGAPCAQLVSRLLPLAVRASAPAAAMPRRVIRLAAADARDARLEDEPRRVRPAKADARGVAHRQ
eukprot:scaffold66075_cov62-Phaeocystis_antarctica.AAC.4